MVEEVIGKYATHSFSNKRLIIQGENNVAIFSLFDSQIEKEEITGELMHFDKLHKRLVISNNNELSCYLADKRVSKSLGNYKFIEVLDHDENKIVIEGNKKRKIWDIVKETSIFEYDKELKLMKLCNQNYLAYSPKIRIERKQGSRIHQEIESIIETKIDIKANNKYNRLALNVENERYKILPFEFKKQFLSEGYSLGQFVKWLGNGKFYLVRNEQNYILYDTNTSLKISETDKNVEFCFYYKRKWIAVTIHKNCTQLINIRKWEEVLNIPGIFTKKMIRKLKKYNQLWLKRDVFSKEYDIYNGITNLKTRSIKVLSENRKYYITNDEIIRKNDLKTINRVISNEGIPAHDAHLEFIIVKRSDGYHVITNCLNKRNVENFRFLKNDKVYTESDIHPKGNIAVLSADKHTEIVDLETFEIIKTVDTNFIRFDKDANIQCSNFKESYWGKPRIFDPVTFEEIEPKSFHRYKFVSWDGKYGLSLIFNKRYELVDIETGDVLTKIENEAPKLDYVNFVAFHPENKIIAFVGKISYKHGIVKTVKISRNNCEVATLNTGNVKTKKAVWKCGFSPNGKYLAAYDSRPNTYVYKVNPDGYLISHKVIELKSFECFSPDNNHIVLSEHKYEAITIGGRGWCPSSSLWIVSTKDWTVVREFMDHMEEIKFANYSSNGKRMISRSRDGIVIVRNV